MVRHLGQRLESDRVSFYNVGRIAIESAMHCTIKPLATMDSVLQRELPSEARSQAVRPSVDVVVAAQLKVFFIYINDRQVSLCYNITQQIQAS